MNKRDLLAKLEGLKDEDVVDDLLTVKNDVEMSFDDFKKSHENEFKQFLDEEIVNLKNNLNINDFKGKLNDKDFKSFMDSEKDKYAEKYLETWKGNHLQKMIDEEVAKATGKSKTPEQLKLEELEGKLASMEKEKTHQERINKYQKVLEERHLPTKLVDMILGTNDEEADLNIKTVEDSLKTYVEKAVDERMKNNTYKPPKANPEGNIGKITWDDVLSGKAKYDDYMNQEEGKK